MCPAAYIYIGHDRLQKTSTQSIKLLLFILFAQVSYSFHFSQLDLLAAASTSKVVLVHASSPSRRHLAGGEAPR
jgi:hypothetical protein